MNGCLYQISVLELCYFSSFLDYLKWKVVRLIYLNHYIKEACKLLKTNLLDLKAFQKLFYNFLFGIDISSFWTQNTAWIAKEIKIEEGIITETMLRNKFRVLGSLNRTVIKYHAKRSDSTPPPTGPVRNSRLCISGYLRYPKSMNLNCLRLLERLQNKWKIWIFISTQKNDTYFIQIWLYIF